MTLSGAFLNANTVICVAWLSNELGHRFDITNCTTMHTNATQMNRNPHTATTCFSSPAIIYLQTLEHPTGADKEIVQINTKSRFSQLMVSQPHQPLTSLLPPCLSHVSLDKVLTAPLYRALLSNMTFANIKHHPCLVASCFTGRGSNLVGKETDWLNGFKGKERKWKASVVIWWSGLTVNFREEVVVELGVWFLLLGD